MPATPPMLATPPHGSPKLPLTDSPARIAAGLIATDRSILPLLVLIIAAPGLVEITRPWLSDTETLAFAVIRECFALAVIAGIGATWVRRLRRENTPVPLRSIGLSIAAGLGIWLLFSIPPLLPLIDSSKETRFIGVLVAVPAVIIGWRYFLLGAPFLLGIRSMSAAFTFARNLTREDPILPARIIAPAVSLKFLLLGILHAFSPDGRLPLVVYGTPILAGLVPVVGCYCALGWILCTLPERTWNELGLDPYRQARTTTLIVQGSRSVARLLTLRAALGMAAIALLIWLGNTVRLATMPPPVEIGVKTIGIAEHRVTLSLDIRDETGGFRGFRPIAFFLASERAFPIARRPDEARIAGDDRDLRLRFPREHTAVTLTVVFSTDRSNEDLRRLEDVYLWYGGNRLLKLDLRGALTLPQPPSTVEPPPREAFHR